MLSRRNSGVAKLVRGIATFGGPRIGDATFASLFNDHFVGRSLRFVHGCDMVAELPTTFAGYCHTGGLVQLASWPLTYLCGQAVSSGTTG